MPSITIKDFRGGLDARKFALALPAGTLVLANNGHITQGGEFEKRKAFVRLANSSGAVTTSLPTGTFGAQPTTAGTVVFGSQSGTGLTFPTGFIYQQLTHPQVAAGKSAVAMTAVVHSEIFAGKAFAFAKFADGTVFGYFDGVLVDDFISGLMLAYMDASQSGNKAYIAQHLAALFNKSQYYTAIQGSGSFTNQFDIFSQPGNNYQPTLILESKTGLTVTMGSSTGYQSATVQNDAGTQPPVNSILTLGAKDYKFVNTLAVEGDVKIGSTPLATLTNLYNAINHTGTPNTDYVCLAANPNLFANTLIATQSPHFTLTSLAPDVTNEIYNNIGALSFLLNGPTVLPTNATKASAHFSVAAAVQSNRAQITVTNNGVIPVNNSTVTVGGKTYTFQAALTNVDGNVKIVAGNIPQTLTNLVNAVNNSGGVRGTDYATAMTANANVTATGPFGSQIIFTAIVYGTPGNSLTFASTAPAQFDITAATNFTGGTLAQFNSITIGPVFASARLTSNGVNVSDGNTVKIDSTTYRFKTVPVATYDILIGDTALSTLQNLIYAINYTGTPGVNYIGSSPNPSVLALPSVTNSAMTVKALTPGAAANALTTTSTAAALTWNTVTLTGGSDSVELLASSLVITTFSTLSSVAATAAAQTVAIAINAYTATSGFTATAIGTNVFLYSKNSNSFYNNAVVKVTTQEQLCIGRGAFQVLQAAAGLGADISSVTLDGVNITSAAIPWPGTVAQACTNLAANINAYSGTSGYVAVASGNVVYISKITTRSSDPAQTMAVTFSTKNLGVTEVGPGGLTAAVLPVYVAFVASSGVVASTSAIQVLCQVTGGYPPYRYSWNYVSGDNGFTVNDPTSSNVTFQRPETAGAHSAVWNCQVTDSQNIIVVSNNVTIYQP